MELTIKPINREDAIAISKWKYDNDYDFYSHTGSNEEVERLLKGPYYIAKNNDSIFGYYCFGKPAQVPDGHNIGAYDDASYIDIGVGMKPELTGKGYGKTFVEFCISFAKDELLYSKFRLTVATFNKRAIKVYENIGFRKGLTFERIRSNGEKIEFIMMHLYN